jgi:protein tyrosine/serine phosphatase
MYTLLHKLKDYLALHIVDHGFIRAIYPNLYPIDEKLFRSGQPSPSQLKKLKLKYGIQTIINLRGENGLSAFKLEKKACQVLGLNLVNLRIYSRNPPNFEEVDQLLKTFNTIKYPALIHCKSGADRTGIVAALYRILILKESIEDAMDELSWKYGHIKTSNTGVLDYFFECYLKQNKNKKIPFLKWVQTYDPKSLKNEFRSVGWVNLITDKIINRE